MGEGAGWKATGLMRRGILDSQATTLEKVTTERKGVGMHKGCQEIFGKWIGMEFNRMGTITKGG